MSEENKVEQYEADGTAGQESPTVEQNQPESEESESAEKLDKTPESEDDGASQDSKERNWRALREENERLKRQLDSSSKDEEPSSFEGAVKGDLGLLLGPEEKMELRLQELRAEQDFPELENDLMFARAVKGEYLEALAEYNQALLMGKQARLPNPVKIARTIKREFDERFGEVSKKAEVEGAKKAQKAKEVKEATVEVEGRSDRARTLKSSEELENLKEKSRQGDWDSVVERLARIGK